MDWTDWVVFYGWFIAVKIIIKFLVAYYFSLLM